MSGGRLLREIKKILGDVSELAGDTPDATSHRILDYVKEIKEDTGTIVEEGAGGGGEGSCDCEECTDEEIDALFANSTT